MASMQEKKAIWWRETAITGMCILSWYIFATLLSLYNKWMFSPQYYGFGFPLFVTGWHMVVQFILAATIRWTIPRYRPIERPTRRQYVMKIVPTAASTGADIGLSNLALKFITLSLYSESSMCKSSTLIFVLGFAFLFRLESYSLRLIAVISLISFGVFLMVFNTTSVSIPGIIMTFSASALAGLRWALTETLMHKKSMGLSNPFATIFWLAPLMAITLALVSMIVEGWATIWYSGAFDGWSSVGTMGVILLPGCIAFAMVASEYFIIQRAGIVPMSVAGIVKEVTTISISAWVFGDQLTELNIIGVVVTVCGIALYSYHKYQKSISAPLAVDLHGHAIPLDPSSHSHNYSSLSTETAPLRRSIALGALEGEYSLDNSKFETGETNEDGHPYPPVSIDRSRQSEEEGERTQRLRDDFEGYNDHLYEEEEGEDDGVEVEEVRRVSWWDRPM
ncbi:hypothetical protein TREMEDRAFT_38661 [Tremella mesenterica DSM 1558]|nr:uncharacterized protein TREMEDRAFT_38661 [Tremella mesenterica DSM 1558]EIW69991.1 hypothetical protein TREMEDRAFT_38661 [Tremella mesenterica DSM 1558]